MTSRTRLTVAILGGLAVLAIGAIWFASRTFTSGTSWPSSARAAFIENCVNECRAAPGVTPAKYPFCDSACTCSADESEKIVSVTDLEEIGLAMKKGTTSDAQIETFNRVKATGMSCATRAAKEQK